MAVLVESGCKPNYKSLSNTVDLKKTQKEKLITGAVLGQTFIPPIENEVAIDSILRKGILLTKFFLKVIPSAQAMRRYELDLIEKSNRESYNCWFESDMGNDQRNNATVEHFLREIEPHLSFIKEILSNPDYKKKLEYYFITEASLISKFEKFVKNQNGSLHQSLMNTCCG